MASKLLRLLQFGSRRAKPAVIPTDVVVPMHFFDDTPNLRPHNLIRTFRFEDVLDADMLSESLSKLFRMEGWTRLGGRLRLRSDGKTEVHIPKSFTADRPPINFTKEHHAMRMAEHPIASKLPKASLKPVAFQDPREFHALAFGPGAPRKLDDYYHSDCAQFSLHVVTFTDGTLVSLNSNHMITDLGGLKAILDAWQLVMAGKQAQVPRLMGFRDDPMAGLYKAEPKEDYALADKQLRGLSLVGFGLRLLWHSWWSPSKSHTLCIPKRTMDALLRDARAQLSASQEPEASSTKDAAFISEGDLIVALINRTLAHTLPPGSTRHITTMLPVDARSRARSVFSPDAAYVGNCPTAVVVSRTSRSARGAPLGDLALGCRRAVAAQCAEEQLKALAARGHAAMSGGGSIPVFAPSSDSLLVVVTNWSKARFFETVDFSPAVIVGPEDGGSAAGGRRRGLPVFYHSTGMESVDFVSSLARIVGRDLDGNLWIIADLPSAAWSYLLEFLEAYS